ncbi:MAG: hypothetical protein IJC48_05820 [Clostridia bacterium]|nr:hypothetical protein [Clostridia bacterium]
MIIWDGSRRLLKGNLHLHTTFSDGRAAPEDAMEMYYQAGYDFLAITDHRKVSVKSTKYKSLTVIQGIEFDFNLPGQVMHIVGVGPKEGVAEAVERFFSPQRAIDEINKAGGCAILAHPAWSMNTPAVISSLCGLTAAEIYNTVSGLPWNADRADSSSILDVCGANGTILNFVASDDAHFYNGDQCQSYIMLACEENDEESIKAALRKGDFYATQGPKFEKIEFDGETMRVWTSPANAIVFFSDLPWMAGRSKCGEGLTYAEMKIQPGLRMRYMRVMLIDENGRRAWSNPIIPEETPK